MAMLVLTAYRQVQGRQGGCVSSDLLILAGLLFNAPQAEAYTWKDGQWGLTRESHIQESQERFQVRLQNILERQPSLLTDRERQTLWQILFDQGGERHERPRQPMASIETEILKMADRLSCVLNLRGQGGVQ